MNTKPMKILVLGASGMLGSVVYKVLSENLELEVYGSLRSTKSISFFDTPLHSRLINNVDVMDQDVLLSVLRTVKPDVVINCVGLIKQLSDANDPLIVLPINSMLPHRLDRLCGLMGSRLIHISTDCVFKGSKGLYLESDISDAEDLYGKSKYIGEVFKSENSITLRTSIIGHELNSKYALVDWFLSQTDKVLGYQKAVFSGVPTVELAHIIYKFVLPNIQLTGLYHVSAEPIDKYSLIKLIAKIYGKDIEVIPDDRVQIDRSLDSKLFRKATGYQPPEWIELIYKMHQHRKLI